MKKRTFVFALLTALLLLALQTGLAEGTACPVNPPPAMGQYATHWQLFTGKPTEYHITLAVEEETGLRTYTLHDPAAWGIAPDAMGTWRYIPETAQPAAEEPAEATEGDMLPPSVPSGWVQTAQGGEGITLELADADYTELGFPAWKAPCAAGADALILNVYLGQVRQLYAYVDYLFGDDSISITAEDHSFIINLLEQGEDGNTTSYASYDSNGILAYASYAQDTDDGSFTAWRVEAIPAREEYQLTTITHMDAAGNTCYWENGEWQNSEFIKVDAPEGISDVPYTITGDWQGIPFAQPGDAPEGTFPAGEHAADAALLPADYLPWPAGEEALYHNWAEGKAVPAMPLARWETLEDGTLAYTLTGVEGLGLQEAHQCDWRWSDASGSWQPEGQPTPGQIRFLAPAEVTDVYWEQPGQNPDLMVMLSLNRGNMRQELGLTSLQDGWWWQMDNQGGLFYTRLLDESRTLTVEYDQFQLLQYDILTIDAAGNPVSQTTYDAPDGSPDTLTLHLYYHYSEDAAQEALWLRDIGWYSYETGKPCEAPEGVNPESCQPLPVY